MSILYFFVFLLSIPVLIALWVVTASCAISWYEYSNRDPSLIDGRSLPERQWLALRLMALETGAILLGLCAHPFGFLPLRPPQPDGAPSRPILLLHGLFHNRAVWFLLASRLRECGYTPIAVNLPPWEDIDHLARKVGEAIEEARVTFDVEKIDLIGHSMGGILARYYLQHRSFDGKEVDHCLLLGAPNYGSKLAPFALSPLGRHLLPGSGLLTDLAAAPLPSSPRFTSIFSHHDNMVIPSESALLAGTESIELEWLGHTTLLFHPDAHQAVVDALRTP